VVYCLMKNFIFSAAALLVIAGAAQADYIRNGKIVDCYCTDKSGSRVDLGQTTCIQVDGRMYTAQCQMSLNVPMWRELSDGCLSSSLDPSLGLPQSKPAFDTGLVDAKI